MLGQDIWLWVWYGFPRPLSVTFMDLRDSVVIYPMKFWGQYATYGEMYI